MSSVKSPVELAWNRLAEEYLDARVLLWDKQSRQVQDAFIMALNEYSITRNYHIPLMVFSNAIREGVN